MKQTEVNFINMTDTVISGFTADTPLWEGKKPVADAFLNIKGYRGEVAGLALDQASGTTAGATNLLQENIETMGAISMAIVQKLRPFALAAGKTEMAAAIDFSKSDFGHGKQVDALNKAKIVLSNARQYQPEMADYELKVEECDALEAAINGVAMLSGNRDAIIGARKTATDGIPELIKKLRSSLEILDDLVPALITNAKFVQTYKNNRRIIDR